MEDDNFFNQSHRLNSCYDPKEMISQQQDFLCHETESHCPYPSSTLVTAATTTSTNFQTTPRHIQNNPSNTIMSETCFHRVGTYSCSPISKDVENSTLSTHILLFMNPIGSASSGSFQVNHSLKPRTLPKKIRSSSESADHTVSERKRRQKLTQNFVALSAIIPGLKKTDKSYILQEAINYVNQLQERVGELETQNEKINAHSAMLDKKLQHSINEDSTSNCETNFAGYRFSTEALPEVKARISEKNVLIAIICEKQNDTVHKILNLLTSLHLSITSIGIFQFGASTLKITIIAQMEDNYSMTIDDLVKSMRKELQKSHDVQQ